MNKETFLVIYRDTQEIEGVFTKESFNKYLLEKNIERVKEREIRENINEFSFSPISVKI